MNSLMHEEVLCILSNSSYHYYYKFRRVALKWFEVVDPFGNVIQVMSSLPQKRHTLKKVTQNFKEVNEISKLRGTWISV